MKNLCSGGRKIFCVAASDRHKQKQLIICLLLPRKINKSKFLALDCDAGYCAAKNIQLEHDCTKRNWTWKL